MLKVYDLIPQSLRANILRVYSEEKYTKIIRTAFEEIEFVDQFI